MGNISYHMVHLYAGPHPVVQSTHATFAAAYAALRKDRDAFRSRHYRDSLLSPARYPSDLRWSDDGGDTLHRMPDAYDYGYRDGDSEDEYAAAVERGMQATA